MATDLEKVASIVEHRLSGLEAKVDDLRDNAKTLTVWMLGIFASVLVTVVGLVVHHILTDPAGASIALKTLALIL